MSKGKIMELAMIILIIGVVFWLNSDTVDKNELIKIAVKIEKEIEAKDDKIKDLKELRKLDDKTIEDLQKRLEDAGLDSSIG